MEGFLCYLKPSFIPLSSAFPFTNLLSALFAPLSAAAEVIIGLSCREAVVSLLIYVIWEPVLASERELWLDQRVYSRLGPAPYGVVLLAPPVPSTLTHPPSLCWSTSCWESAPGVWDRKLIWLQQGHTSPKSLSGFCTTHHLETQMPLAGS